MNQSISNENMGFHNIALKIEKSMYNEIKRAKRYKNEYIYMGEKDFVRL